MSADDRERFIQEYDAFCQTLVIVPRVDNWTAYSITSLMETSYTYCNSTPGVKRAKKAIEVHAKRFEDAAWEELKSLGSTKSSSLQIVRRIQKLARGRGCYTSLLKQLDQLERIACDAQMSFEELCREAGGW